MFARVFCDEPVDEDVACLSEAVNARNGLRDASFLRGWAATNERMGKNNMICHCEIESGGADVHGKD